jgi:hypothetical protein
MKRMRIASLMAVLVLATNAGWVSAQTEAPLTRAQVKMERDEFRKSHTWDAMNENWVLKPGYESPAGTKSRVEIKAERDEILRNNRWDEPSATWISLKGKPRDLSKMSREQMRAETRAFVRTHSWDEVTESWIEKPRTKKK